MVGTDRRAVRRRARRSRLTRLSEVHASFLRKRRAHRLKSKFDITISTKRFGQYSKKICAAQNDRAHKRNEIRRGKQRTERVKNPWHGFARKNEPREENARQQKHHRHLQRLHLVFGSGPDE